jgi:N,N'-diacetylchitobiose transport system substrate-binding protein
MKRRYVTAAVVATAVAVAAVAAAALTSTAEGRPGRPAADKLTVWLHPEAEGGWPQAIAAANRAVRAKHSGVDIDVQSLPWGANTHAKFKAALAAGNAPDVIEHGNSETLEYMAAGAFASLKAKDYPNYKTWLKGLTASCQYNGKLYCVPYYAGARAVIYRTDYYRKAGIKGTPKTLAGFVAAGQKLMKKYGKKDRNFSAYYHPGKNWYVAISFVEDYGGQIAVRRGGKWRGTLDSPQAIRALTVLKSVVNKLSRASKTTDEDEPYPAVPFGQGKVASFIGNGWELPMTFDPKWGKESLKPLVRAYPMPSHIKGRYMPAFLGGSVLAVPVTSKEKAIARDWIKAFTTTAAQRAIAKPGNIANTTKLARIHKNNPQVAPFAEAAKFSWFIPTSANWPKVENALVLQNMMVKILTNRTSVKSATRTASSQITKILNG